MMRRAGGFTMVELVMVIIMLGILAVFVMPRMDTSVYRALEFHDQTVAALRYAQKTATSHRRMVCVAFSSSTVAPSTVTLTIDQGKSGTSCGGQVLNLPGANSNVPNVVQSRDTANSLFSATPVPIYFQPDGRGTTTSDGTTNYPANPTININGQTPITVVGATGYVQ